MCHREQAGKVSDGRTFLWERKLVRDARRKRGGIHKQGMSLASSPLGSCLCHKLPWVWDLVPGRTAGAGKGARFPAGTLQGGGQEPGI